MIKSLGFSGTRRGMTPPQRETVEWLLGELDPKHVHHGDCIGADAEFHELAKGRIIHIHPPTDGKLRMHLEGAVVYEAKPYLRRNKSIVNMSDALIATPAEDVEKMTGSGTWATIRYAKQKGIPVFIVIQNGGYVVWKDDALSGLLPAQSGLDFLPEGE